MECRLTIINFHYWMGNNFRNQPPFISYYLPLLEAQCCQQFFPKMDLTVEKQMLPWTFFLFNSNIPALLPLKCMWRICINEEWNFCQNLPYLLIFQQPQGGSNARICLDHLDVQTINGFGFSFSLMQHITLFFPRAVNSTFFIFFSHVMICHLICPANLYWWIPS